ncbi:MAG: hypothetical protein CV087_05030 [Candidatus Brocadia sp. WS118]|nr:MAG: hypothetical protein CV087_05030 [Candidatus Brocadia sp. WS118]
MAAPVFSGFSVTDYRNPHQSDLENRMQKPSLYSCRGKGAVWLHIAEAGAGEGCIVKRQRSKVRDERGNVKMCDGGWEEGRGRREDRSEAREDGRWQGKVKNKYQDGRKIIHAWFDVGLGYYF